jgi:hypothetical protein
MLGKTRVFFSVISRANTGLFPYGDPAAARREPRRPKTSEALEQAGNPCVFARDALAPSQ